MTSSRPYLIRAIYEWLVDNDLTPYILVDAAAEGVQVPARHIQDGKIVFNVAPRAVSALELGNDQVRFHARFSGTETAVCAPVDAVLAIYARENGQGMAFADEDGGAPPPAPQKPGRPSLKVVK